MVHEDYDAAVDGDTRTRIVWKDSVLDCDFVDGDWMSGGDYDYCGCDLDDDEYCCCGKRLIWKMPFYFGRQQQKPDPWC